ncbi:hypothetical protein SAMN06309944_0719 [Micrococcales bacterium KH10]|nr:hypothetical protein SAMN06309944_0719 [Micrococcales bacterium KH10]
MKDNLTRLIAVLAVLILGTTLAVAPAHAVAAPKMTVAVKATPISATKSRVMVRVKVRAKKQQSPVVVQIKVGKKTKQIRAKYKNGHYRAKTTIKKSKAKKAVVRALGVKKTLRIKKTSTKATARVAGGTGTGKRITVTTPSGGAPVKLTGTLNPALGRKVLVQRQRGNAWTTQAILRTSKARKVTWSATLPAVNQTTVWRVQAPATATLKAITVTTVTITPKSSSGGSGGNNGGDGTTPPVTWLPGQRNCLDNTGNYGVVNGEVVEMNPPSRIPGCADFGSATVMAEYAMMGQPTLDDRCGVTITCWREPTPAELARGHSPDKLQQWSPPPGVYEQAAISPDSETLYMPTLVDDLNALAVREGWISQAEIEEHGPPFRHYPNAFGTWGGFPSLSAPEFGLVPGQGGNPQYWMETVTPGRNHFQVSGPILPPQSSNDGIVDANLNFTQLPSTIGRHPPVQAIGYGQGRWSSKRMDVQVPNGNPNYHWACINQTWNVGDSTWTAFGGLTPTHYNDLEGAVLNYIDRGYEGPDYISMGGKRWPNGRGWIIVERCQVIDPTEMSEPDENGYQFPTHRSLPGDPWG